MNRTNRVSEMHSYREKVDWKAFLNLGSEVPCKTPPSFATYYKPKSCAENRPWSTERKVCPTLMISIDSATTARRLVQQSWARRNCKFVISFPKTDLI